MNKQSQQEYLKILEEIVNYPMGSKEQMSIMQQNIHLFTNTDFLQVMREFAQQLEQQGNHQIAMCLNGLAEDCIKYSNPTSHQTSADSYGDFLTQTVKLIDKNVDNSQLILYWQQNQHLLDESLLQYVEQFCDNGLSIDKNILETIVELADFALTCHLPSRSILLEIAIIIYNKTLQIYTKDVFPVNWAAIQTNLGVAYWQRILGEKVKNLKIAVDYCKEALEVYKKGTFPLEWAVIQTLLAGIYRDRIPGDKVENLKIAVDYCKEALEVYKKDTFPLEWARIQNNLGAIYSEEIDHKVNNFQDAIFHLNEALKIYTQKEFPEKWAMIQNNLGTLYLTNRRDNDKPENLQKALDYYKQALNLYTEETFPIYWAGIQNNLGIIYSSILNGNQAENLELAILCYQEALKVYTQEAFPEKWAMIQNNLGNIYDSRIKKDDQAENLELAILCYQEALKVYTQEAFPEKWAMVQMNLAGVYCDRLKRNETENLKIAINYCENALKVYKKEKFLISWARTQNSLGNIYRQTIKIQESQNKSENLEKAIDCFQNAAKVFEEELSEDFAVIQNNLGLTYRDRIEGDKLENLKIAISCHEQALNIYKEDSNPIEWARTKQNLAGVYAYIDILDGDNIDNLKTSTKLYLDALKIFKPENFPLDCLQVSQNLGNLGFKVKDWQLAIQGYSQAIKIIEGLCNEAVSDINRQKIIARNIVAYRHIVQSYINLEKTDKAFEYVERSKTRNLVRLLSNLNLYPKGNIPQNIIDDLDVLRKEIVVEEEQIAKQERNLNNTFRVKNSDNNIPIIIPDRTKLNKLKLKLDNFIKDNITLEDPTFNLTEKVPSITFDEIKKLIDDHTAIIEWYITDYKIVIFIITSVDQQPIVEQVSPDELIALSEQLKNYLSLYKEDNKQWQQKLSSWLEQFSKYLHLDEIIKKLPPNCHNLILVPYVFLHILPIHALPVHITQTDGEKSVLSLLDLYEIQYIPSCQILQMIQHQSRESLPNFFAIQNPTSDLFYTDIEVDMIRQLFKPKDDILANDQATKENLIQRNLSQMNSIHFSCHGYFNFMEPLKSALLLKEKKLLTLGEIITFNLKNCSLVTLSACETGIVDLTNVSDEYISLPSSFFVAGSTNVISTLWTVNDFSTALLMIKFYNNHIKDKLPITKSLNSAQKWLRNITKDELQDFLQTLIFDTTLRQHISQLDFLQKLQGYDKPFANPYYWAAFCTIGK